MDLAKIRKKAQLERTTVEQSTESPISPVLPVQPPNTVYQSPKPAVVADLDDFFSNAVSTAQTSSDSIVTHNVVAAVRHFNQDPLEILLDGRSAAGCNEEELLTADDDQFVAVTESYVEFLCIKVSDEIYGINIMDIKEIIKPRQVTEVPRAPSFVSGVISLRGTIIPVIDMLLRLGLTREKINGRERVVVIKNGDSFCGLMVDEVSQVVKIANDVIEPAPAILEGIDRDFVSGIGRADGKMVIILNLVSIADIHLF